MYEYLYNLANFILLFGLCFRQILLLRIIMIVAELFFGTYAYLMNLPSMLLWSFLYLTVNSVQIFLILKDRIPKDIPLELRVLKERYFNALQSNDFLKLIKFATRLKASDKKLIAINEPVHALIYVLSGNIYVEKPGISDFSLCFEANHFVGEMSYFNHAPANADVIAKDTVEYLAWPYEKIKKLQQKDPPLFMAMIEAMGKDMLLKMLKG